MVVTYYVNHYLPHGQLYPTGDPACISDDRGCWKEAYREDLSNLVIPDWAKFIRQHLLFLFLGLGVTGVLLSNKETKN